MKISIGEIGKEMAELHHMALAFDDAATGDNDIRTLDIAHNEAFDRLDNLKKLLNFQRPDCIGDVLILTLLAANHLEQLQPNCLPPRLRNANNTDQYINASKIIPILRLLDAIITGIEEKTKLTREDLGLAFLREREDDKKQIFEKALDMLMESEARDQKAKQAA